MKVNFEETDTTRPIISVKRGAEAGAMTVFKPDGRGRVIPDLDAIKKIMDILDNTEGFNVVHWNCAAQAQEERSTSGHGLLNGCGLSRARRLEGSHGVVWKNDAGGGRCERLSTRTTPSFAAVTDSECCDGDAADWVGRTRTRWFKDSPGCVASVI